LYKTKDIAVRYGTTVRNKTTATAAAIATATATLPERNAKTFKQKWSSRKAGPRQFHLCSAFFSLDAVSDRTP
jgi:hypothetical protein